MKEREYVGEEVMQWAEKYWLIDKIFKGEIGRGRGEGELLDWKTFRATFIKAINGSIENRLNPTDRPTQGGSLS